jgi:hypothetical protein
MQTTGCFSLLSDLWTRIDGFALSVRSTPQRTEIGEAPPSVARVQTSVLPPVPRTHLFIPYLKWVVDEVPGNRLWEP